MLSGGSLTGLGYVEHLIFKMELEESELKSVYARTEQHRPKLQSHKHPWNQQNCVTIV